MHRTSQETSERLSARVDALAAALDASGADPAAVSRLLGGAASAVLQALTLDLLHEPAEPAVVRPAVVTAPVERELPQPAIPLAA
jgi:hypothetical protein